MNRRKAIRRIFICTIIFVILFNYFQITTEIFNTVLAANIEVEEIEDGSNNENYSDIEIEEIDSNESQEIEVEEIENEFDENQDIEDGLDDEIVELLPIENAEVELSGKIDKKIKTTKGIYIKEEISIKIHKNNTNVEQVSIQFNSFSINDISPSKVFINNRLTTINDEFKIQEDLSNNDNSEIELKYNLDLEYEIEDAENINQKIDGIITLENATEKEDKLIDLGIENTDEVSSIKNDFELQVENQSIYKGLLRANCVSENNYDTRYMTIDKISFENLDLNDFMRIDESVDKISTDNGMINLDGKVKYVQSRVSKSEFDEHIGLYGFIEMYCNDELVGMIDSNSELDGDYYVYNYSKEIDHISILIHNSNKNGNVSIQNIKTLKGDTNYTPDEITNFKSIVSDAKANCIKLVGVEEIEIAANEKSTSIQLEETISKADLSMNKNVFSSESENDVSFKITIDNNSEKYELFENPTFDISLPSVVENVEIEGVYLLYKNGLNFEKWDVISNANGRKIIRVSLSGKQQDYSPGTSVSVTEIIINTKIKVNELTPDGNSSIELSYTNQASNRVKYKVEGKESESYPIQYKSRSGLLTYMEVNNLNNDNQSIKATNSKVVVANINTRTGKNSATVSASIVNNYKDDINNLLIIGRIPSKGMINSDDELINNTINTELVKAISTSGLLSKVYYSPLSDCSIDDNSWVENPENISEMKSFKIELDDSNMSHGEKLSFETNFFLPESLRLNQNGYMLYTAYYNYNNEQCKEDFVINIRTEQGTISEQDCQTKDEIIVNKTNGNKIVLGTRATVSGIDIENGQNIYDGQIVRYSILVENNSNEIIRNIHINEKANNANLYYLAERTQLEDGNMVTVYDWFEDVDGTHKSNDVTIEQLLPGEKRTLYYEVFARKQQGEDIFGIINIKTEDNEEYTINTVSGKIVDSGYEIELFTSQNSFEDNSLKSNSNLDLSLRIRNNSEIEKQNVNVRVKLPKLVSLNMIKSSLFKDYIVDYIEEEDKNVVLLVIDKLPAYKDLYYTIPLAINSIPLDINSETIEILAKVDEDDKSYISNDYYRIVEQSKTVFEGKITSNHNPNDVVSNGEQIQYDLDIKNSGLVSGNLEVKSTIPAGIKLDNLEIIDVDSNKREIVDEIEDINSYLEDFVVKPNENIHIKISGSIDHSRFNVGQTKIEYVVESPQLNIDPYVLTINEEQVVNYEWFDKEEQYEELDEDYEPEERIQEIYTGIGKTTANLDIDIAKYNMEHNLASPMEMTESNEEIPSEESIEDYEDIDFNDDEEEFEEYLGDGINVSTMEEYSKQYFGESEDAENKLKTIAGIAWIDQNKDSIKNDDSYVENMNVYLYKDEVKKDNQINVVQTDGSGSYRFENIEDAEYYVVFDYNSDNYDLMKYDNNTSSVNEVEITIDDTEKTYAISDKVPASMVNEINIGLLPKNESDFTINSYVESITVINDKDVEKYNFDKDTILPKIEIAKDDVENAIVRVKYSIEVTNKGNVDGYVLQLKDVVPEGFIFEEGQNLNWNLGNDGFIYYSGLSKDKIESGNTKKISLVLTKEKSSEVLGTFSNRAEIVETTNDMLVEEINMDNNYKSQDLIISVKTGVLTYILIIILITIVLVFILLILVNQIVKDTKLKKKILEALVIIFILTAIVLLLSNTFAIDAKKVESISNINEFIKYNNNTLESYDDFKSASEMLDLYKNNARKYILDGQIDNRIQYLNIQDSIIDIDNDNRIEYGISSIFNVNSNYLSYKTIANDDVVYTGESEYAAKLAFMGYLLDSEYNKENIENNDVKYNLSRLLYYADKNSISTISDQSSAIKKIIGSSYSFDYDVEEGDFGTYDKIASKYIQYREDSQSNSVEKINSDETSIYNIDDNLVGPFYLKAPLSSTNKYAIRTNDSNLIVGDIISSNNYVEYFSIDNKEWKGLEAEIIYNNETIGKTDSSGKIETNVDLSNKSFLLKISNDDIKNDVSQLRIKNKHNEYEATGINFNFIRDNEKEIYPDISVIRGKEYENSSEQTWKYSSYNVYLDTYTYKVYKSNNDQITDTIVDSIGDRAYIYEDEKYEDPIEIDLKDIIITCVEFNNYGRKVNGFTFSDMADTQLTYLGYMENVPETGVPEIINDSSRGNWTISNKDNRTYTYNGQINPNEKIKLYLVYRLDEIEKKNQKIGEITELKRIEDDSNIIDLLDDSSIISNSETFMVRNTYVDISSSLYSVNGNNNDISNFNVGDEIVIRTNISNVGEDIDAEYGSIYNVRYSTNYELSNDKNIEDYLDFNGFSMLPGDFTIKGSEYIERLDDGNDGFSYDVRLNLGVLPGDTVNLYTSYTIKQIDEEEGLEINPNNELKSIENRNGDLEIAGIDLGPTVRGTNDIVIKNYKMNIKKEITSVTTASGTNTNDVTRVETGDIVNYKVTVSGDGTPPLINKTQYVVIVLDYSNSMIFWRNFEHNSGDYNKDMPHGGRCANMGHHPGGDMDRHNGKRGIQYGCKDRLDQTVKAINSFTSHLFSANPNNRVALTMFASTRLFGDEYCDDSFYNRNKNRMNAFKSNSSGISSVLKDLNKAVYRGGQAFKPNVGIGTHYNDGFNRAINILKNNSIPNDADVTVVFMSDGDPGLNGDKNGMNQNRWDQLKYQASGVAESKTLKRMRCKIMAVGIDVDGNDARNALKKVSNEYHEYRVDKMPKGLLDLAKKVGGTTINAEDYLKIKELKLKDTLPPGISFKEGSLSSGSSWNNATKTITYLNNTGVPRKHNIVITFKGVVDRFENTTATLTNKIYVVSAKSVKNLSLYSETNPDAPKYKSSVSTQYQIYNGTLNKYISAINGVGIGGRANRDNTARNNAPVEIEKGDRITYTIEIKNTSTGNNNDKTNFYQVTLSDKAAAGITLSKPTATYDGRSVGVSDNIPNNPVTITCNQTIGRGKALYINISATVTASNFTLENLENSVQITKLTNRNGRDILPKLIGYNLTKNKDYIRLKNLFIGGNVWNDTYFDTNIAGRGIGYRDSIESGISGIEVRLIDLTNKKYISTITDASGNYKFGTVNAKGKKINITNPYILANGELSYTETNQEDTNLMCDGAGRVIKATNRSSSTGNYASNSKYIDYVIEFKYDGIDYYTTTYSGRTNINNSTLAANGTYKVDSNAKETNESRNRLYNSLDTIYYNKAQSTNGAVRDLSYIKDGHESRLRRENMYLKAYSFINSDGSNGFTPLWLKNNNGSVLGESGYLNNINLGLIGKNADIEVSNDVASITRYINGEETTYNYLQGDVAGSEYAGAYRTGGENADKYYEHNIYLSDYYYQSSEYNNPEIEMYKQNTELEIQVTYKMTIYNKSNNNRTTYARIKEITDYYGKIFKTDLNQNIIVKVYNVDGELVNKTLNSFVISNNYNVGKNITYADRSGNNTSLNKLYLKTPIDIAEGGKAEFYLTYTIDKNDVNLSTGEVARLLMINDEKVRNILEINAYSIYKNNSGNLFGLVDKDSNPGNLANNEDVSQYEDDTYEAILKISLNGNPNNEQDPESERFITGYAWEDVRSNQVTDASGTQYVGNGFYNTSDQKDPNAISLNTNNFKDKKIPGVTAHLIEEIRIKQDDGSYKLYDYDWGTMENTTYKELSNVQNQKYKSTTDNNGIYKLTSIIPGTYKVRYYYGYENDDNTISDNIVYNGQDFKSTMYTGINQDASMINALYSSTEGINENLTDMTISGRNDAVDDELRRLETMAYAEVQTNKNQAVINQTNIIKSTDANKDANKREFIEKTYMYAETPFMRINSELTRNAQGKIELNKKAYSFYEVSHILDKLNYKYKIDNIDLGLEYRPKVGISLNKFLSEFKVVLSDKTTLVDLKYDNIYDEVTHALIGTQLNRENSLGIENTLIVDTLDNVTRGSIVVTVDPALIQGATVYANYVFSIKNEGEVDRISAKLDDILNNYEEIIASSNANSLLNRTVSAIAYNRLYNKYGADYSNGVQNYNLGNNLNNLNYKKFYTNTDDTGYYGEYLGNTYYRGTIGNDVISKTKINNIVDYVPNGLEMDQNQNIGINNYWSTISLKELSDEYIDKSIIEGNVDTGNIYDKNSKAYYDRDSGKSNIAISVDDDKDNENAQNNSLARYLIPICADNFELNDNGTTKSSAIIKLSTTISLSNSDQLSNMWYTNIAEIMKITSQTARCPITAKDKIGVGSNYSIPKTRAINLPTSITQDDFLESEFQRELISTVGNCQPKLIFNIDESDTDMVDPIVLIPPTGVIPFYLKQNSKIIITLVSSIVLIVIMFILGHKNKVAIKKAIKRKKVKITFKKYYK